MLLTNHSSAFSPHDVHVVKNVACLSSLLTHVLLTCLTKQASLAFTLTLPQIPGNWESAHL